MSTRGVQEVGAKKQEPQRRSGSGKEVFLRILSKIPVDNKGIIDELRKGEKECIKPRAGGADLWKNLGRNT